jgi:tRNA threonylcarbamoyladenosine biosynthesis protein TsaB
MRALAFDTSSKTGALVALEWQEGDKRGFDGVKLVGEWALNLDASFHSERLLWSVHQLLEASNWKLEEVDVFGVGVGPGSFTGLRIGLTTARTLATVLNKPLVGVSSLAALARPAALSVSALSQKTLILAATDACKGELFILQGWAASVQECAALSQGDQPGLWKRGVSEEVVPAEKVADAAKKLLGKGKKNRWMVVGEARHRYPEIWKKLPAKQRIEPSGLFADSVQGRYLGQLVWEGIQAGLQRDALGVSPRYLRASDAELKLEAGLLPPGPKRTGTA